MFTLPADVVRLAAPVVAFVVVFAGPALGQGSDDKDKKPVVDTAGAGTPMHTLDILALGQKSVGIVLPEFDDEGRPAGKITVESATRTSEDALDLTSMRIDLVGETGDNIAIDLPAATFNLTTSTLVGTRDVVITRIDFTLTGDRLEFNTKTRESVLYGNIKMIIHKRKQTLKDPDAS